MAHPVVPLLVEAGHVLAWGQGDFANLFGVSRRTIQRWDAQGTSPDAKQLSDLARAVYPRNHPLAARLAQAAGTSLEQLGLVVAPLPSAVPPAAPPPPEPPPFVPSSLHTVDSITCAAADAMNMVPEAVRPALRAAFERARDLRLSAADVASALSPAQPTATTASDKRGKK